MRSLDAAGGEAAHDVALEGDEGDDHRGADDDGGGHELIPVDVGLRGVVAQADGEGAGGVGGQDGREEHFAPGGDEGEDGDGDDAGEADGDEDPKQGSQGGGAVDQGGLFEFARDGVEVADEHPDREGQREGQVGDDQPQPRAVEGDAGAALEVDEDDEQRQQEEDAGEHLGG